MANTATLGEILIDLRGEMGQSLNPLQTTQVVPAHRVKVQRVQRMLWHDFAWPHLRTTWDVVMQAGEKLYDLPAGLALERLERVEVKWGSTWNPVARGIGADEWSAFDPDSDERADPVTNWMEAPDNQFQVWPLPAGTDNQTLRFTGIKALGPFVADGDQSTLDRDLIVLTAAAELAKDPAEGQKFAARAQALYSKLKGNSQFGGDSVVNLNGPRRSGRWPTPPRVSRG